MRRFQIQTKEVLLRNPWFLRHHRPTKETEINQYVEIEPQLISIDLSN